MKKLLIMLCVVVGSVAHAAPIIDSHGLVQDQATSRGNQVHIATIATSWAYHLPPTDNNAQSPRAIAATQAVAMAKDKVEKPTSIVAYFASFIALIKS